MTTQTETLEGYQLSPQQARVFFLQQAGDALAYRARCSALWEGDLDPELLKASIAQAIERHEILRTAFRRLPGVDVPLQVIAAESEPLVSVYDLSACDPREQEARTEELFREAGRTAFDYERGPLVHVSLLRLSPTRHVILLSVPAVCADGAGLRVLLHEIGRGYAALVSGEELSGEPLQYADFAQWQNELLESEEMEEARSYWRDREFSPAPSLPCETRHGAGPRFEPESVSGIVRTEVSSKLETLAARYGTSPAAVLLSCWNVLLWRLTQQSPMTTGVFFDGRKYEELKETLGLLGAYLPVECRLQAETTFGELLTGINESLREAHQRQEYFSWEEMAASGTAPDSRLLPYCFEFESEPAGHDAAGLPFSILKQASCLERFKLKLSCVGTADALTAELHYDAALFGRADAERLAEQFHTLLENATGQPGVAVGELNMASAAEREKLIVEFNDTAREYNQEHCVHRLFEAQAAASPDQVAIEFRGEQYSYGWLDERANRLARLLRARGVRPDSLVALCLDRSPEMVVAILAVLKAGGAYLPLDPAYPADRLRLMLADSRAALVVTTSGLAGRLGAAAPPALCLDVEAAAVAAQPGAPLGGTATPDHLAYVIYTSGSTGAPKGVMISHRSICNRLLWMVNRFGFSAADSVLQKTSFSFDASVWEFYVPLISGGRLVLAEPGGQRDSGYLAEAVRRHQISTLQLVPSMFDLFVRERGLGQCRSLRWMFSGGEALSVETARRFQRRCPWSGLTNLYGPTEVSIDATYWRCEGELVEGSTEQVVPIGTPVANVRVHVLDAKRKLAAIGEQGEIYVGGVGLARGYMERAGLTAERFVPDPYDARGGGRLYRTGDLGRRSADGAIEYCGRLDGQVKLRGHRIEVGEVEAALREEESVREAAVVVREDAEGQQSLVAYVVVENAQAASDGGELYQLPNGLRVSHLNRNETELLYREIFADSCYLRHGVSLPARPVVFDIGANIGLFSLFVHAHRPAASLFCFEPMPRAFAALRANAERHGLRAHLFACGLGEAAGEARFTFYPRASAMSGRFADPAADERVARAFLANQGGGLGAYADELMAGRFESEEVVCRLRTISEVIGERGVERIDLLKVDAERSELEVLRGVSEADWAKVRQVVVEVHDEGGRLAEVVGLLERHGFRVVVEQEAELEATGLFNLFAVHPDRLEEQKGEQAQDVFVPGERRGEVTESALLRSLSEKLPSYMVPTCVVTLEKLPLLPNGKVDRKALPAPEAARRGVRGDYVAPRTPAERLLAGLWADLLKVEKVGVHDDFFHMGGHSLRATQLVSRVREAFQSEVLLSWLFESPTVARFAETLIANEAKAGQTENVARILEMVQGMSAEEVGESLKKREQGKGK